MKNYAIAAFAAVPCIAAVAPAATLEDYTAIFDAQMETVKELVTVLTSVNDKATADAAVEKLAAIVKKGQEAEAQIEALGEPSPEIAQELMAVLESRQAEIKAVFEKLFPAMVQLQMKDFYGSEELKNLLESMGNAEIEVEEDDVEEAE